MGSADHKNAQSSSQSKILRRLRDRATKLGFDHFGVTDPSALPDLRHRLQESLDKGHMAGMTWMGDNWQKRAAPQLLWPQVKSIIMLAMNYGPSSSPLDDLEQKDCANISVYARHDDYHELIKGRLKEIAGLLAKEAGGEVKVFVDTAPVMEKPLAQAAGIGWQGKHTALVSKQFGSWTFLGAIFTSLELPVDEAHPETCGTCTKCLDICPTKAFPAPFQLDASKCLAYYSNEHHGPIPHRFRKPMGNRIFGCDDCLAACPWNKFAKSASEIRLQARDTLSLPKIADLLGFDEDRFKEWARKTPLRRLGYQRFLRNLLIVAGNSDQPNIAEKIKKHMYSDDATVRGAAIWALGETLDESEFAQLRTKALPAERDAHVRSEWEAYGSAAGPDNGEVA